MNDIILWYHFTKIAYPESEVEKQQKFCKEHNLKGRIIISKNGINGTLGGNKEDILAYKKWMHNKPEFKDTWFKKQSYENNPFPRLQIRAREELCTLRAGEIKPEEGGIHLEPHEVNELAKDPKTVFFDARNDYEFEVGRFENAYNPNLKNFRDLPEKMDTLKKDLKDKNVIMYCTGGIRCEVASVLLKEAGIKNVYQIKGGIYNYNQQYPNHLWKGSCVVFDNRQQIGWNEDGSIYECQTTPCKEILSSCKFCGIKTNRIVSDERVTPRERIVCCESCDEINGVSVIQSKRKNNIKDCGCSEI